MRLSKRKAWELCKELYEWAKENYGLCREDGFVVLKTQWWEMKGLTMQNGCPACRYNTEHKQDYCGSRCILNNVWPGGCIADENSPYRKIMCTTNEEEYEDACQKIIDGCNERLKKVN